VNLQPQCLIRSSFHKVATTSICELCTLLFALCTACQRASSLSLRLGFVFRISTDLSAYPLLSTDLVYLPPGMPIIISASHRPRNASFGAAFLLRPLAAFLAPDDEPHTGHSRGAESLLATRSRGSPSYPFSAWQICVSGKSAAYSCRESQNLVVRA
jgi:hypothetical protein